MFSHKKTKLQPIDKHLAKGSMPQAILLKGKHLHQLAEKLHAVLPSPLAQNCKLANLHNQQLVFLTSNAQWATQLRAIELPLLQAASELSGYKLEQLTVKVEPNLNTDHKPSIHHAIPAQSASHLLQTAEHLDDNPRLQKALRSLARHGNKSKT